MATQFEFRLIGADAPEGKLDADQLVAIVESLKNTATRLGRAQVDSAAKGRPSKQVDRVARLRIGMGKGSTRIMFERSVDEGVLPIEFEDERTVDEQLQGIIAGIACNERPAWVSDSQAAAAGGLVAALQKAAQQVEFRVDGSVRTTFRTVETHRETWLPTVAPEVDDTVTIAGRLEKVDLKSRNFRIRDDVDNAYTLPKVMNDIAASRLIGSHVSVTGVAERDTSGRITGVRSANVVSMADPLNGVLIAESASIEDILADAPGLEPGGIPDLSDEEADAFFEAMGM